MEVLRAAAVLMMKGKLLRPELSWNENIIKDEADEVVNLLWVDSIVDICFIRLSFSCNPLE